MPEQIKKRFIKRDELSFEVTVYPDSENPEEDLSLGHVLLSGITERLDRDDNTAWLEVVVKAKAAGFVGQNHLGGICLAKGSHEQQIDEMKSIILTHNMFWESEGSLLRNIEANGWPVQMEGGPSHRLNPPTFEITWK